MEDHSRGARNGEFAEDFALYIHSESSLFAQPHTTMQYRERVWDEVTTCSKSCNRKRKSKNRESNNNSSDIDAASADAEMNSLSISIEAMDVDDCSGEHVDQMITQQLGAAADDGKSVSSQTSSASNSITNEQQQSTQTSDSEELIPSILDAKAQRKAEKKRKKAERRAQREGRGDPTAGQKQCTICDKSVNLLIRCTYDKSGEWVST